MTIPTEVRYLNRNRVIVFTGLFLCALLALFIVFRDDPDQRKDISVSKARSYIEGLTIIHKKSSADSWVVTAKRADLPQEGDTALLYDVHVDVKKEGLTLTADRATYHMNTKDVALQDNIKMYFKDSVISAKSLSWNASTRTLSSPDRIEVVGSKFRLEGEGFTATNDDKIRLTRNVKATFF